MLNRLSVAGKEAKTGDNRRAEKGIRDRGVLAAREYGGLFSLDNAEERRRRILAAIASFQGKKTKTCDKPCDIEPKTQQTSVRLTKAGQGEAEKGG